MRNRERTTRLARAGCLPTGGWEWSWEPGEVDLAPPIPQPGSTTETPATYGTGLVSLGREGGQEPWDSWARWLLFYMGFLSTQPF